MQRRNIVDWLGELITAYPALLLIPLVIVITIFAIATRRSHLKHIEEMDKIQNNFDPTKR